MTATERKEHKEKNGERHGSPGFLPPARGCPQPQQPRPPETPRTFRSCSPLPPAAAGDSRAPLGGRLRPSAFAAFFRGHSLPLLAVLLLLAGLHAAPAAEPARAATNALLVHFLPDYDPRDYAAAVGATLAGEATNGPRHFLFHVKDGGTAPAVAEKLRRMPGVLSAAPGPAGVGTARPHNPAALESLPGIPGGRGWLSEKTPSAAPRRESFFLPATVVPRDPSPGENSRGRAVPAPGLQLAGLAGPPFSRA